MTITFARRLFLVAGIYGVLIVTPMFYLEATISELDPPVITHPEFYYGFVCVTLAWQIVYLMMWKDPLRLRPVLIPAIAGKTGFGISVLILFALGRLKGANVPLPSVDLILAVLFAWAYVSLGQQARSMETELRRSAD